MAKWPIKLIMLAAFSFILSMGYGSAAFWYLFDYRDDYKEKVLALRNYNLGLSSVALDDGGEIIGKFAVEDRIFMPFNEIPPTVVSAIVAAEDREFFTERWIKGIDPTGITRAVFQNLAAGKTVAGGSTITQQLAKNLWLNNERTLERKLKEARLAYQMEKHLPKELIFEIYANLVYFGHGKYGVATASEFYFGKKPAELAEDEAAMLAGLIKWPYQFSPLNNPKVALSRRNSILQRMYRNGFIADEKLKTLKAKPLSLNVKNGDSKAPYLSSFLMDELHRLGYEKVVNEGLQIQTSINIGIQEAAERAFQNGLAAYEARHKNRLVLYNIFSDYEMKSLDDFKSDSWDGDTGIGSIVDGLIIGVGSWEAVARVRSEEAIITAESFSKIRSDINDLTKVFKEGDVVSLRVVGVDANNNFLVEIVQPEIQGAVVVLDVLTGGVKAIVGGRDFKISKYNRAMQADRQPGSAFKPFVYGAFFEKYSEKDLQSTVLDSPICFKTGDPKKPKWCPKNYEEKSLPPFMGPIPVKIAMARSRNVAAVRTAYQTGIDKVVELANNLGITNDLPRYLPTAIGAADVKVIDMARAYAAFFRGGKDKSYWFISEVSDKNRRVGFPAGEEKQALSSEAASKVLEGMRWVVLAGTARSASRELPFAVAGKTGTTNGFTDAWFVGGTPKYVVAVWIGFDRKAIPLVSRESSFKETGGSAALPIFIEIMKEMYKDRPYDAFPEEIENRILGIKKPEPQPLEKGNPVPPVEEPESEKTTTPE